MTLQAKFTEKYGISPLKLVEDTNYEYLGFIKKNNLTRALERYIEEKKLNIEVNSEFEKDLVEAFAEAGERFPESGKIGSLEKGVLLSIPNVNASVPKSKGTLENFKEIVGKDELRPVMSGVFVSEDGASLVGTDAHKLVVQKTNEYSEYAGKIIDLKVFTQTKGKKIPFIDGKYPNYNAVIPKDNPNEVKNFDTYALYNAAKSSIAVHKLVEQTLFNLNLNLPTVNGDGTMMASFNPVIVADVTTFALVNGWNKFTLEYSTETRAYILNFGEGNIGLIMPIMNRYGDLSGLHGGEVMTPEEIMDKYKFSGKMKSVKPAATKTARPSAPVSSEPFKEFKGEYDEENTTYVLRRDIESITLTNGEVLGKNDVVQGFYRVKKKMAHGGSMYADGGNMFEKPIAMYREVSGKTRSLPESTEVYESEINRFIDYVHDFYEEQGYTKAQVKTAVNKYLRDLDKQFTYGGGDSLDRERVYEYLLNPSLNEIKNPSLGISSSTSSDFEVGDSVYYEPEYNPKLDKGVEKLFNRYANRELVIEEIEFDTPFNTAKALDKASGRKLSFDLVLNPEYIKKYAHGGSMYADKIPSRPFLVEIKPLFEGEEPLVVRVSPDTVGEFTAGYTIYSDAKSTKKVGYVTKPEMEGKIENGEYKILSDSNKYAHGGSMYAGGGKIKPNDSDSYYRWRVKKFGFKPYGKEKGRFKVTYIAEGEPQQEIHTTKEMAIDTANRYKKIYEDVKIFDESDSEIKYAHGGSMYADGGTMGRVKVGTFNEAQLKSGEDKLAIEKAQKETGLTYIDSKITKKGGKMFMEVYLVPTEEYLKSAKFEDGGSMYAGGGKIDPIDMAEVESSAIFYTEKGKWSPEPTVEKFENQIREYQEMKRALDNKEIRPSKVIGTGIKPQYVRPLAYRWIEERTLIAKRAIEILKERMGGAKSSSHEVGDTVTFNSVMGGTKTGTIISKMGEEGFRIQVGNGFATVKKSAIV